MGLRIFSFVAMTAASFVLFSGDSAHAGPKTKVPASGKPSAGSPQKPAKPDPGPLVFKVCVRPEGVEKTVNRWTFGETLKPVVSDVDRTAKLARNPIYEFDENAHLDSPQKFPARYNQVKCPNDKRQPAPPPPPKPQGILPPSGPLFESTSPLGPSGPFLAPVSLSSSGTGKSLSTSIEQFMNKSAQFRRNGSQDEKQATQFVAQLRNSITSKTPCPEIYAETLSPEAAAILAAEFGADLAAAMAKQPVIGPANVLKKMVPTGKNAAFGVFQLIEKDTIAGWELKPVDGLPSVILPLSDYEQRTKMNQQTIQHHVTPDMLREQFKRAYADKPDWFAAIKTYFDDP